MSFDWTLVGNVVMYFFAPGEESGLFDNFWDNPPLTYELKRGHADRDLSLTLSISKSLPKKERDCVDKDDYSAAECSRTWVSKQLLTDNFDWKNYSETCGKVKSNALP